MICRWCKGILEPIGATVGGAGLVACKMCGLVYVNRVRGKKFIEEKGGLDSVVSDESKPEVAGGVCSR